MKSFTLFVSSTLLSLSLFAQSHQKFYKEVYEKDFNVQKSLNFIWTNNTTRPVYVAQVSGEINDTDGGTLRKRLWTTWTTTNSVTNTITNVVAYLDEWVTPNLTGLQYVVYNPTIWPYLPTGRVLNVSLAGDNIETNNNATINLFVEEAQP